MKNQVYDALVIGAGYYGCRIALHLKSAGFNNVMLVERESDIMQRASFTNQARVHNGYHYPRSITTAYSSRKYYRKFIAEHDYAMYTDMRKIYAIAKDSKVSASQFESLCDEIGAPLYNVPNHMENIFDSSLIDQVYLADEISFDASLIAQNMKRKLKDANIDLKLNSSATLSKSKQNHATVNVNNIPIKSKIVINCTYSELDLQGIPLRTALRREWAELAIIQPPPSISKWGITVMDGPFFSVMPFPAYNAHTLSHVRFTPMTAWTDHHDSPSNKLKSGFNNSTNGLAMIRDSSRYIPILNKSHLIGSIYEVKTVLVKSDNSDSRPILFEFMKDSPNIISVLGGKIDNIYDVLDELDQVIGKDIYE